MERANDPNVPLAQPEAETKEPQRLALERQSRDQEQLTQREIITREARAIVARIWGSHPPV